MTKIPVSVAIITKNEALNLPNCLKSVTFAAQIVVVDSGSTDETIRIARDWGCDVYEEPWRGGFGAQKQFAIERCREPWILVLDADERIPEETAVAISRVAVTDEEAVSLLCYNSVNHVRACSGKARGGIKGGDGQGPQFLMLQSSSSQAGGDHDLGESPEIKASILPTGYSFPRKNFFQGRWIRHAGWWPDRLIRLFRRGYGRMSPAAVHEGLEVTGTVVSLDCPIEHYTESDLGKILAKIDRYSTLGAREAYAAGRRATVAGAVFRAGLTFFQGYFLRRGFLDGSPGLTLAVTDAVNKFFKYAKLSELGSYERHGGMV